MAIKEDLQVMGQKIRTLRTKKGFTQDELAKKMGYTSRSTINKIEKGLVDIPQTKLKELANILDTTPLYLLGWVDNPDDNKNKITVVSEEYGTIEYYFNKKETKEVLNFLDKYFEEDK